MKIAIVLCTLFALTLAVRPVPVNFRHRHANVRSRIMYPGGILRRDSNRIIGGNNDVKDAHIYQISLQRLSAGGSWYHTCGGSIISSTRILTAAHCVDDGNPSDYKVIAGEYELYSSEGTEQTVDVSELIVHPDWNEAVINNDVAVIRLSKEITLGPHANAVTIASEEPVDGSESTVTGWGYTNYQQQTRPTILQVLKTYTFNPSKGRGPGSYSSIWDSKSQVATKNKRQGICMGDSGGPLVLGDAGLQYGVCSYVLTPCGQNVPDYYANAVTFKNWIMSQ